MLVLTGLVLAAGCISPVAGGQRGQNPREGSNVNPVTGETNLPGGTTEIASGCAEDNGAFALGGQTTGGLPEDTLCSAGMSWVKHQHKFQPGHDANSVKGWIDDAHANGFRILLSIPGPLHPQSIDDGAYVDFVGAVAALGPDAIEIWNEPNLDREWPAGQISPETYVHNMLAPAYQKIKAANPNVMVISGAPAPTGYFSGCSNAGCDDLPFIQKMAAAGAANHLDCVGVHYNEGAVPPSASSGDPRGNSGHYTRYFNQNGMIATYGSVFPGKPLCFTEIGYLTGDDYGGVPSGFEWASGNTIDEHAQWLGEAAQMMATGNVVYPVRLAIVFNVDFTNFGADPMAGYAIIRKDGSCPACSKLQSAVGSLQ